MTELDYDSLPAGVAPPDSTDPDGRARDLMGMYAECVALCRALMEEPDVLLLDEPTNHLDAHSVAWLEGFLRDFKGAVVTVTHDRSLLESVAGWIVDVEYGGLRVYEGNYSHYLEHKAKLLDAERAKEEALRKALSRELEFVRSNRRHGGGGAARRKRYDELVAAASDGAARAASMTQGAIVLPPPAARLGSNVLKVEGLSKRLPALGEGGGGGGGGGSGGGDIDGGGGGGGGGGGSGSGGGLAGGCRRSCRS